MQLYVVITQSGGVLDDVMPFEDKDDGVREFKHQAMRYGIEADEHEDNYLDEEKGIGYYTDGESEDEIHLQHHESKPKE